MQAQIVENLLAFLCHSFLNSSMESTEFDASPRQREGVDQGWKGEGRGGGVRVMGEGKELCLRGVLE